MWLNLPATLLINYLHIRKRRSFVFFDSWFNQTNVSFIPTRFCGKTTLKVPEIPTVTIPLVVRVV